MELDKTMEIAFSTFFYNISKIFPYYGRGPIVSSDAQFAERSSLKSTKNENHTSKCHERSITNWNYIKQPRQGPD